VAWIGLDGGMDMRCVGLLTTMHPCTHTLLSTYIHTRLVQLPLSLPHKHQHTPLHAQAGPRSPPGWGASSTPPRTWSRPSCRTRTGTSPSASTTRTPPRVWEAGAMVVVVEVGAGWGGPLPPTPPPPPRRIPCWEPAAAAVAVAAAAVALGGIRACSSSSSSGRRRRPRRPRSHRGGSRAHWRPR
jgi:hypothetical protein